MDTWLKLPMYTNAMPYIPLKPRFCYSQRHFAQDQDPKDLRGGDTQKPSSGCLIRTQEKDDKYLHPLSSMEGKPPTAIIFIFVVHLLFESVININIFQTPGKASPSHKKTLQLCITDLLRLGQTSDLWPFFSQSKVTIQGHSGPSFS